jgi:hypothetical protein
MRVRVVPVRGRVLVQIALAALHAGCTGGTMQEKGKRVVSVDSVGHRLEVEVLRADEEALDLRYSFHNGGQRSAYLFNRIYSEIDAVGVFRTDRDRVYVEVGPKSVMLSKKIFPVPQDIDVEQPVVPLATRVAPGESVVETIKLRVPLTPHTPYLRGAAPDPQAAPQVSTVEFELGFFVVPPEREHLARAVTTSEGSAYSFGSAPAASQTILRAGPLVAVPARPLR